MEWYFQEGDLYGNKKFLVSYLSWNSFKQKYTYDNSIRLLKKQKNFLNTSTFKVFSKVKMSNLQKNTLIAKHLSTIPWNNNIASKDKIRCVL